MYRNSSDWKRKGLERQWSSFSDAIKRFSEQVRAMSYDGITVYENDRPCASSFRRGMRMKFGTHYGSWNALSH